MRHGPIPPQIQIPPVHLLLQPHFLNPCLEHLKPFLPLRAAHNLSDLRDQNIEGLHGLAILVELHVEGLDCFGVVVDDYGGVEDFLAEVALVLGGQVHAPRDFVLEFHGAFLQEGDGLAVGQAFEGVLGQLFQGVGYGLFGVCAQPGQVGFVVLQDIVDSVFQVCLSAVHNVFELGECQFWFDHPELSHVPRCIRYLSSESGSKSIYLRQAAAVVFNCQLPGNSQICLLLKEVFGMIFFRSWWKSCNPKHFSSTLAIGCCYDWRVNVKEAILLEEIMGGIGYIVLDSSNSGDQVCSRSQMRILPQRLKLVILSCQRVLLIITLAQHPNVTVFPNLNLDILPLALGPNHHSLNPHTISRLDLGNFFPVRYVLKCHNLQAGYCTTVTQLEEHEFATAGDAGRLDPASHFDHLVEVFVGMSEQLLAAEEGVEEVGGSGFVKGMGVGGDGNMGLGFGFAECVEEEGWENAVGFEAGLDY